MVLLTAFGLMALTARVLAKEMAVDPRTEPLYESGAFMSQMMAKKEVWRTQYHLVINLTGSRQPFLDNGKQARITLLSTHELMIPSNVSKVSPLRLLETQTTHFVAIM
jgi:hypothetical protein